MAIYQNDNNVAYQCKLLYRDNVEFTANKYIVPKFYWEKLSWDMIATELQYANADSAKTQKNRCMNKIKTYLANHHVSLG